MSGHGWIAVRVCALCLSLTVVGILGLLSAQSEVAGGARGDYVLVLDNSGSMKQHDPEFLVRNLVEKLAASLSSDDRFGIVVFDSEVKLVRPLGPPEAATAGVSELNYGGALTRSASALERALREIKENGRPGAEAAVVFLTDGLIDTGDPVRDAERRSWATGTLAQEMLARGVRCYGIALGEGADFELIQRLAQTTEGDYFSISSVEEGAAVFGKVAASLRAARSRPAPTQTTPEPDVSTAPAEDGDHWLWLALLFAVAVIGWAAKSLLGRRSEATLPLPQQTVAAPESIEIPGACLQASEGVPGITDRIVEIDSAEISVGSNAAGNALRVEGSEISANHFRVHYDAADRTFSIVDNSLNGTWLLRGGTPGGRVERLEPGRKTPLRDGDRIILPGLGRDQGIDFHLTSRNDADRARGVTQLERPAMLAGSKGGLHPLLSFTYIGVDERGHEELGPSAPGRALGLIERIRTKGGEEPATYRLTAEASGLTLNDRKLAAGEAVSLVHGDRIMADGASDGDVWTFEDPDHADSERAESGGAEKVATPSAATPSAATPEQASPGAQAEEPQEAVEAPPAAAPAEPVDQGQRNTVIGAPVARGAVGFSQIDPETYRGTATQATEVSGARASCANHPAAKAVQICAACSVRLCDACAKDYAGRIYCDACLVKAGQ